MALSRPDPAATSRSCSTKPFASPAPNSASASTASSASFPGLGDVLAGLLSLIIPLAAWIRGVPYVTLVRMAANLGIGVLVGTIPIASATSSTSPGKPNRRNYRLLQRHLGEPRRHTWRDWAFLAAARGRHWRSSSPFPSCLSSGFSPGCSHPLSAARLAGVRDRNLIRDTIEVDVGA